MKTASFILQKTVSRIRQTANREGLSAREKTDGQDETEKNEREMKSEVPQMKPITLLRIWMPLVGILFFVTTQVVVIARCGTFTLLHSFLDFDFPERHLLVF